jgi:hypothetical protein
LENDEKNSRPFFTNFGEFLFTAVTAISTVVITIFTCQSTKIQKELEIISDIQMRMLTEPILEGSMGDTNPFDYDEIKNTFTYRLLNIGSDTAWAVYAILRPMVLTDTLIYKGYGFLNSYIINGPSGPTGSFSRANPLPPAATKLEGFGILSIDLRKLSELVDGTPFVEAECYYWSNSPIKRFNTKEYFLYNQYREPRFGDFTKITDERDTLMVLIRHLMDSRKIGQINYLDFERISPLTHERNGYLNNMIVMTQPVFKNFDFDIMYFYKDTAIVTAEGLIEIGKFRNDTIVRRGLP